MIVIDGIKIIGAVFVIIYVIAVIKGSRKPDDFCSYGEREGE